MAELPRSFENDEEEAAAHAFGRLNPAVSEAPARDAQDALFDRLRFMQNERDNRMRKTLDEPLGTYKVERPARANVARSR